MIKSLVYWFIVGAIVGFAVSISSTLLFREIMNPSFSETCVITPNLNIGQIVLWTLIVGGIITIFGFIYYLFLEKK